MKFKNLGLAIGMALRCYTKVAETLKLKVKKFWALILTFVEVIGGNLVGGFFGFHILNRINAWISGDTGLVN